MPIEIREIIIKTTVGTNEKSKEPLSRKSKEERQALIQECVDQVIEILKEKTERWRHGEVRKTNNSGL